MCCLVPVSYLSLACLCPGYRPACQSQGRRPDSGSGRGLTGPIGRWGRGSAPARGSLGTWPDWELARRGVVGNRHAGFGHALRKTQIRWALSKGHSELTLLRSTAVRPACCRWVAEPILGRRQPQAGRPAEDTRPPFCLLSHGEIRYCRASWEFRLWRLRLSFVTRVSQQEALTGELLHN